MAVITNKAEMHQLMEKATEFLIERAKAYKEIGANGIFLAEPTAGILSPKMAAEFSDQYVKRIVDAVQDEYFYVILHDCGSVTKMTEGMYGTGAKGFHFGNAGGHGRYLRKNASGCAGIRQSGSGRPVFKGPEGDQGHDGRTAGKDETISALRSFHRLRCAAGK